MDYVAALALTLAVEAPVYAVVLTRLGHQRLGKAIVTGLVANLASHPAAFLVAYPLLDGPLSATAALALVELAVLAVEAAVVRARGAALPEALVASAAANLASLTVGVVLLG